MYNLPTTHPETAWLSFAVLPALTAAVLLVVGLLLRGRVALLLAELQRRYFARRLPLATRPDPALLWSPAVVSPQVLVAVCLGAAVLTSTALTLVAPLALALLAGCPTTALVVWALLYTAERRYVARLEVELTEAVGRLSALLRAGSGLRQGLERVIAGLPSGPLHEEWAFLVTRQGAPLAGGSITTPQQVLTALADQTLSRRHAVLLNHLAASAGQPQDVVARRCEAAYAALQASERRRDEAATELAQVRYSGVAVGLAGAGLAVYLLWSQWERAATAYSSPLGTAVGAVVLFALALPIVGGVLLARVEDADY